MDYQEYLGTPEWRAKREWALERAGRRCQVCNSAGTLHVHHRTYENLGHELPADLTVLCTTCHGLYHGKANATVSPESVCDIIRSTKGAMMMGPTGRRWRMVEPEEPSTDDYIRRAFRALSVYPFSLRPIVAGAILETQLLSQQCVLDLFGGCTAEDARKKEQERGLASVRDLNGKRRAPA